MFAAILRNKWITVTLCSYEVAAILARTEKIPPITAVVRKRPWVGAVLTAAMGYHFIEEIRNGQVQASRT